MRMEIKRYGIEIIPEDEEDIAYIEEVLGLKNEGDKADVIRYNVFGTLSLGYVTIKKQEKVKE